ncbi:mercury resistance system transport protein MerF [Pontibacillus salicampi]|uniref:Mercury resistance system transport protein MerF n=1 Tax=Pontibacillus salicampi TaxID=1449801 RepID=A0ABV6LSR4_9BACI
MKRNNWFVGSIVGFIIILLCCTTPLLVIMLGVFGLGAWTGYLDYILFPMLIIFLILAVVTYKKKNQTSTDEDCCS